MIIGIIHHDSTKEFLPELLESLRGVIRFPKCIVYNNKKESESDEKFPFPVLFNPIGGFELGALKALVDVFLNEDDFFLLQESTLIKDPVMFDIANKFDGSVAVCPGFGSYIGKYRRRVLEEIGIPIPKSRKVEIMYEYYWNIIYMNTEKRIASLNEPLVDTEVFEEKFGRKNMVLENCYMKKWKSNWGGFRVLLDKTL